MSAIGPAEEMNNRPQYRCDVSLVVSLASAQTLIKLCRAQCRLGTPVVGDGWLGIAAKLTNEVNHRCDEDAVEVVELLAQRALDMAPAHGGYRPVRASAPLAG